MTEHPLKKTVQIIAVTLAASAFGAMYAAAFTETPIKPPAGQVAPEAPAANLNIEQTDGSTGLMLTTPGDASGETELTIPGVGTIGKIPKVDFGLELLYGNSADETPNAEVDNQQDDVLIKGKIRHRF
ncbi:MAG: hypothetical protein KTR19_00645 [Hyphomicrobiales bacterium]|nr:hypothetical protein [Hyphomicrobiales bacterium]